MFPLLSPRISSYSIIHVLSSKSLQSFKECFSCFSRHNAFPHTLPLDELKARQLKLMKMIYNILHDAHFEPITLELYKNSIEKVFLTDVPIKVDWAKLDSHLLTTFYDHYPSLNPYKDMAHRPPFYRHFSVFYRGYGLSEMESLFITPKLNLILADLEPIFKSYFSQCIAFLTATLHSKSNKKEKEKSKQSENGNGSKSINSDVLTMKRVSLLDTYKVAKSKGIRSTFYWLFKNIKIQVLIHLLHNIFYSLIYHENANRNRNRHSSG